MAAGGRAGAELWSPRLGFVFLAFSVATLRGRLIGAGHRDRKGRGGREFARWLWELKSLRGGSSRAPAFAERAQLGVELARVWSS